LQLRGSEYISREAEIVPGGSVKQPGKLTQRTEAGTIENSWNCRKLSELPGKMMQRAEAETIGNSRNCRELKLSGTAETTGKVDAEGKRG